MPLSLRAVYTSHLKMSSGNALGGWETMISCLSWACLPATIRCGREPFFLRGVMFNHGVLQNFCSQLAQCAPAFSFYVVLMDRLFVALVDPDKGIIGQLSIFIDDGIQYFTYNIFDKTWVCMRLIHNIELVRTLEQGVIF